MKTVLQTESLQKKSFVEPDESQHFDKATMDKVKLGRHTVKQITYMPGWRWSKDMKPTAKTNSCQQTHFGLLESGSMHVAMDNGKEVDFKAGDLLLIPPGHDGWVTGKEPALFLDFGDLVEAKA